MMAQNLHVLVVVVVLAEVLDKNLSLPGWCRWLKTVMSRRGLGWKNLHVLVLVVVLAEVLGENLSLLGCCQSLGEGL